jgi:hypothetical protein
VSLQVSAFPHDEMNLELFAAFGAKGCAHPGCGEPIALVRVQWRLPQCMRQDKGGSSVFKRRVQEHGHQEVHLRAYSRRPAEPQGESACSGGIAADRIAPSGTE